MVNQAEFKKLTDKIINSVYNDQPGQLAIYNIESEQFIEQLFNEKLDNHFDTQVTLEGGNSVEQIVECLSVVLATFKVIKSLYINVSKDFELGKKKHDKEKIKKKWKKTLLQENVNEQVVDKIADSFSKDL